ncbi:MAG TPA: glycosyltransferase [Pyrinomonadaceae bacterium]|jgi:glycosyltransferase involved in cell wall biosynthesis
MHTVRYKVAHVMPWAAVGGTEHATLRVARATEAAGFGHVMFCRRDAPEVRDFFAAEGFDVETYDPVEPSYRRADRYVRDSYRLAREFRRRRVRLVHCADVAAAFTAGLAGRLAGARVVCHVRNRHAGLSRRDVSFLGFVGKFVFVSEDTWRKFAYKVAPSRGAVVYDGLEVGPPEPAESIAEVRREFGVGDGEKVVGMVARVAPQKDFPTLARAAARVLAERRDVRFMVVGDYEEANRGHYDEVRRALADAGVESRFVFTGFRTDVARLMGAFDIFVLCTHFEGLPLVILEAMARGRPVVATAVDGIPEIVIDGETGLLHPHGDADALAARLLSLLGDGARAARLGEAGREFVKMEWSRERFAANMVATYRDALGLGRAGVGAGRAGGLAEVG